jgi:flagellar basal-body rod modification protein FlgD
MATISSSTAGAYQPSTPPVNPKSSLKSEDFINLLITQLKNQDPMQPMKNEDLLQQVSQIGTLQSQNALQQSLSDMVLQNQISNASSMIGRKVAGLDGTGEEISGVVTTVRVVDKQVVLELDNGKQLPLSRVTDVASARVTQTGGSNTSTGTTTPGAIATPDPEGLPVLGGPPGPVT